METITHENGDIEFISEDWWMIWARVWDEVVSKKFGKKEGEIEYKVKKSWAKVLSDSGEDYVEFHVFLEKAS